MVVSQYITAQSTTYTDIHKFFISILIYWMNAKILWGKWPISLCRKVMGFLPFIYGRWFSIFLYGCNLVYYQKIKTAFCFFICSSGFDVAYRLHLLKVSFNRGLNFIEDLTLEIVFISWHIGFVEEIVHFCRLHLNDSGVVPFLNISEYKRIDGWCLNV